MYFFCWSLQYFEIQWNLTKFLFLVVHISNYNSSIVQLKIQYPIMEITNFISLSLF